MPYKFNEPRRHRIPRTKYRVTNWPDYDRGLVERGDVRFWIADDALAAWCPLPGRSRGRPLRYSDLAIETVLLLAAAFDLPLRQTEGFARSILALMDLDLPVPDHTTLARRRRTVALNMHTPGRTAPVDLVLDSTGLRFFGPGEWARLKHGEKRRDWRKLHISVDAGTGEILSHFLTNSDTSDAAMAGPLVETAGGRIRSVIADGAYYGAPTWDAIRNARPAGSPPRIIIPPPRTAIPPPGTLHGGTERECDIAEIAAHGRIAWQKRTGYGKRSLAETAISRLTSRGGKILRARTYGAQCQEIGSHIAAANKAIRHAKPITVRVP